MQMLGSAVRALVSPRTTPAGINPAVGVLFLTMILPVYGAPLAYGATLVILWPAAAVLPDIRAFTWWTLTLVATLVGGS